MNSEHSPLLQALGAFFGVAIRPRPYLAMAYLWLAFPAGLFYFIFFAVSLPLGIGLTIVWVGLLVLFAAFVSGLACTAFERFLARGLLGVDFEEGESPEARPGFLGWLRGVAGSAGTWKGFAFLALKFPLGLVSWVVSLVAIAVPVAFLIAPLALVWGGSVDLGFWAPETPAEAWPVSLVGVVLLLLSLHLHVGLAAFWSWLAKALLDAGPAPTPPAPVPTQIAPATA